MNRNWMWIAERGVWLLTFALAVMYVVPSVPVLFGAGDWDSEAMRVAYGVVGVSSGAAMLVGLLVGNRGPWVSAGLVIGGAVVMAIIWFWLFYALVPLTLLVAGFAVYRARRETRGRALAPAA